MATRHQRKEAQEAEAEQRSESLRDNIRLGVEIAGLVAIIATIIITLYISAGNSRDMNNALGAMSALTNSADAQADEIHNQAIAMLDIGNSMVDLTGASIDQAEATDASVGLARQSVSTAERALEASRMSSALQRSHDLYLMRSSALQAYIASDTEFYATMMEIRNRLPIDIEERSVVNSMTIEQAAELQKVVEPILAARIRNNGVFRSTMPVWPQRIRAMMIEAGNTGDLIADCYESGAMKTLNQTELLQVRYMLNKNCRQLGAKHSGYRHLVTDAYEAMVNEVYNAAIKSGNDPEVEIPDTIRPRRAPNK